MFRSFVLYQVPLRAEHVDRRDRRMVSGKPDGLLELFAENFVDPSWPSQWIKYVCLVELISNDPRSHKPLHINTFEVPLTKTHTDRLPSLAQIKAQDFPPKQGAWLHSRGSTIAPMSGQGRRMVPNEAEIFALRCSKLHPIRNC